MKHQTKEINPSQKAMLEKLYLLYEQPMYRIAYSILHQTQQAEDAVQDTFVKLTKYLSCLKDPDSDKTKRLVIRILKTTAIDQYRKNHKESLILTSEENLKGDKIVSIDTIGQVIDRELISRLLYELQPIYITIIELRCFFGFSNQEAAKILNISEDVAAKRYQRAKKSVQTRIGDVEYETESGFGKNIENIGGNHPHRAVES